MRASASPGGRGRGRGRRSRRVGTPTRRVGAGLMEKIRSASVDEKDDSTDPSDSNQSAKLHSDAETSPEDRPPIATIKISLPVTSEKQ